jgi:hypothetical protein
VTAPTLALCPRLGSVARLAWRLGHSDRLVATISDDNETGGLKFGQDLGRDAESLGLAVAHRLSGQLARGAQSEPAAEGSQGEVRETVAGEQR